MTWLALKFCELQGTEEDEVAIRQEISTRDHFCPCSIWQKKLKGDV